MAKIDDMKALVGAAMLLAGCNTHGGAPASDFTQKKVTVVQHDGVTVPVPAGYRDSSELSDAQRRADIQARVPGATILIAEKQPGTGVMIALSTIAQQMKVTPEVCIELSTDLTKSHGGKIGAALMHRVNAGEACKIDLDINGTQDSQYYIPVDTKVFLVTCTGGDQAERDAVCSGVANSIVAK